MEPEPVQLYVYDLSSGLAAVLSPAILDGATEQHPVIQEPDTDGRRVEGIWHTSIVVYNREFFYGAGGVTSCAPGSTQLGAPLRIDRLGDTHIPYAVFVEYLEGLSTTTYRGSAYNLLEHNCNHFSDEVAGFLCGASVPKHIVQQGQTALPPALRATVQTLLGGMVPNGGTNGQGSLGGVRRVRQDSPDFTQLNSSIEEARAVGAALDARRDALAEKLARKQRRKERKARKERLNGETEIESEMAEALAETPVLEQAAGSSAAGLDDEQDPRTAAELKRRQLDPPIVFTDLDGAAEFDAFTAAVEGATLSGEDLQSMDELRQYLVLGEGSWVLGDEFMSFLGRILQDESLSGARTPLLRCLGAAALRDDVALVLHQDRKHHALLNHANKMDVLPDIEQQAIATFMCNLFSNISSSEWLLYISEWDNNGQPLSNIRATTKVCVHAVLSSVPALRDVGTALLYNLAAKEVKTVVFDEVCAELALAALQMASTRLHEAGADDGGADSETQLYRALTALARLAAHSADVPQLIQLVGPQPDLFRGVSQRVDEQIDHIMKRIK